MTPKELLLTAADFFEQHPERWVKGSAVVERYFAAGGLCFCMMGKLAHLAGYGVVVEEHRTWLTAPIAGRPRELSIAQGALRHTLGTEPMTWNDDQPSVLPIIYALRDAAHSLP